MKKLAKKIIAAVAGIAAIAACAVPFRTGGAEALIAGAETPAVSYDLELANEYRVQDGVKMSPIAYIDVERSCEHGDGAASDADAFTVVFDKSAAEGKTFSRLWVYTTSYGAKETSEGGTGAIKAKPIVRDTDGTTYGWAGSGLANTIATASSIARNAEGSVGLDGEGVALTENSSKWYVFSLAANVGLQTELGATSGLQTLESFSWEIDHVKIATHFEIGSVYGETAAGEKVRLFDPETCTVKSAAEEGAGNYVYASGGSKECFTVKKKLNETNFDLGGASDGWHAFDLPFAAFITDMSAYRGISIRVKNASDKPIFFNKYFNEKTETEGLVDNKGNPIIGNKCEIWYDNQNYAVIETNGETQYYGQHNSQVIPAGFDGRIVVPFSAFVTPAWKQLPDGKSVLDTDDIASLSVTFQISGAYSKGALRLSDFRLEKEAKVGVVALRYIQWEDGRYLESAPFGYTLTDGAEFKPDAQFETEIEFNGKTYVLDEAASSYDKADPAAYIGGSVTAVKGYEGAASAVYRPKLYYRLPGNFVLKEALYPKSTKTVYPKGTTAAAILKTMPDGFAFGNQYGGIMQLSGEWSVKSSTETEVVLAFTPSLVPSNIVIADESVFTVKVSIAANYPPIESISVRKPTKTTYVKGEELDLAGLEVAAKGADGKTRALAESEYEISGYDKTKTGEQTITVTAEGKTATFTVTVIDKAGEKTGCASAVNALGVLAAIVGAALVLRRK